MNKGQLQSEYIQHWNIMFTQNVLVKSQRSTFVLVVKLPTPLLPPLKHNKT